MSEFHLRTFIKEVMRDSGADSPRSLAHEVLNRLEESQLRDALAQALPLVCQNFLSTARGPLTAPRTLHREMAGAGVGSSTSGASQARVRMPRTTSWKNGHGDPSARWRARLEEPFGYGSSEWAALGDCTVKILSRMAEWRDSLARKNQEQAAGAREWIELLETYEVETIRQLPEEVLRQRLGGV